MRYAAIATAVLLVCVAPGALAGLNPEFTLPLHAKPGLVSCTSQPVANCATVPVNVVVSPGMPYTIYLMINSFQNVAGFQCAFVWPSDWLLADIFGCCRSGCIDPPWPPPPWDSCDDRGAPPGHCGGPTAGAVARGMNCFTSTGVAVYLGRWLFYPVGASGCFSIIEPHPRFPNGIHVIDCQGGRDRIQPHEIMRLGKICVGSGGHDACARVTPVEPATWGDIKASYR